MAKQTELRKRAQQISNGRKKERQSFRSYLKGVRLEMKKVVWPTKKELGAYTVTVIATCLIFSLAFWVIDTCFLVALKNLLGIKL